jgi:hypothetical protein
LEDVLSGNEEGILDEKGDELYGKLKTLEILSY